MTIRQMTATVYILEGDKFLLIFHKKLRKWLPPGGHLDPNELPSEAALREAKEETGLEVELIPQENLWIDPRPNGRSVERPYMCLLEKIPAFGDQPPHEHIDFIYVGRPAGGTLICSEDLKSGECGKGQEIEGIGWFSLKELDELELDVDIFGDTLQIIKHLSQTINLFHLI